MFEQSLERVGKRPLTGESINATSAIDIGTELVERARAQSQRQLPRALQLAAIGLAAAFLVTAVGFALLLPEAREFSYGTALVAVLAYAIGSRVEVEAGNMFVFLTQPLFIPMLFVLPVRSVPLLIAVAYVLAQLPNMIRGRLTPSHLPVVVFNAAFSLGPVLVLALYGSRSPRWSDAPIYLAALAAQFAFDFGWNAAWSRVRYGLSPMQHLQSMRAGVLVDSALAPVGLVVAIATNGRWWGVLVVLPLIALLTVFSRERQVRIDHALELSHAYRGTAMLLGDVIEADDEYTGSHSRDVVSLTVEVADRLNVDPITRQQAELAAMLHDVGKIKVPAAIINKPGPLDESERAVMNQHTIVGEELLNRVGGLLGAVGHIVRSCHERWDGGGYPDGIAGETIPLAARIVCACDAWSAMTTNRSYRPALAADVAAAELRDCAGTQFDPRVVVALLAVLDT